MPQTDNHEHATTGRPRSLMDVLAVSMKLGLTSFGGPVAHLGYFHNEYIRRRKWMDERSYADLVALCQFLPGPASSQVGIGIGVIRAGLLGGFMAWLGFTLPSVILLVLFAFLLQGYDIAGAGWIHGLKIVAVAIVAHAVLGMGQKLAADRIRATIMVAAAALVLLWTSALSQVAVLVLSGAAGLLLYRNRDNDPPQPGLAVPIRRRTAIVSLLLFFGLLAALPIMRSFQIFEWVPLVDSFYRAGSLVFGGGHVVLPLLEREIVPAGWVGQEDFLAGYGAAQAVPGPLFTFAAYLGAMAGGIPGAALATIAIFLPAYLLIVGTLPFWSSVRQSVHVQGALKGINAAVVGILLAALYNPIWVSAINTSSDFVLALLLFSMLVFWKCPPWIVVIAGAAGGLLLGL